VDDHWGGGHAGGCRHTASLRPWQRPRRHLPRTGGGGSRFNIHSWLMRVSARRRTRSSICEGGREPGWVSPWHLARLKTLSTPHGTQLGGLFSWLLLHSDRVGELYCVRPGSEIDWPRSPLPGRDICIDLLLGPPKGRALSFLSSDRASREAQQS
jgi:hypothetical protein